MREMSKGAIIFPALYRMAWLRARYKRPRHKALSDVFLWHDVYDFYAESLPRLSADAELDIVRRWQEFGDEKARARLLEGFYYIVRPIAGKLATKRFPPGLWPSQKVPGAIDIAYDGHRDRIHELASVGIFGLFVAADRFNPASGYRFSTYANDWVRKYIQLYCEEMVSVVPRTGDLGPDKPRRSVMDIIDAALSGVRLYRGKAARGMAVFDAGLVIDGKETDGSGKLPDFEYLSTEGPTREYLQRRVGVGGARFPWPASGPTAMVVSREVIAPWVKPNPLDDVEFTRGKRDPHPVFSAISTHTITRPTPGAITAHGGGELCFRYGPSMRQTPQPAEICYISKQRPDRQYNSWEKFGAIPKVIIKPIKPPNYWDDEFDKHLAQQKEFNRDHQPSRKETSHESEVLRRADAVQVTPGTRRRRGRRVAQADDVPVSILPTGTARKIGT